MKQIKFISLFLTFLFFVIQAQAQTNKETLIQLKNCTVFPADVAQPGSGIEHVADGKRGSDNEMFHSLWNGIPKQDIIIEADLDGKGKRLDKVVLSPRESGLNGILKNAELWIMFKGVYQKVAVIAADCTNETVQIELEHPINDPEKVKLIITDAYGDPQSNSYIVSLGELACMTLSDDAVTKAKLLEDMQLFSDGTGRALRSGVQKGEIVQMKVSALRQLATSLFENSYRPDSLSVEIQPMLHPDVLGKQMRIGNGYSKLEGITGIVLNEGDNFVFVGKTNGIKVKLIVPDWTRKCPDAKNPWADPEGVGLKKEIFSLNEGVNYIHLKKGGNVYVQYFSDANPNSIPTINVHFPTGTFNGYFDLTRGDTEVDFSRLLTNAVSPILDMRGKHIQVAFPVERLKEFTLGKGVQLLNNYDSIVGLQYKLIGWEKEGIAPKNHVLVRVNYHYYMFRDDDGVAFVDQTMKVVADPKNVLVGDPCWGFTHELGHIHQMRPQMTWGGMTEVSNNILAMFCTTTLGNPSRLTSEKKYEQARKVILDKGISFMDFPGAMSKKATQYGGNGNTDVFQRLVPFWQLYLYFKKQGYPDFYPDLMIAMRKQEPLGMDDQNKNYLNMLEFCRLACQVSKTDLTDFFQRWGFFYVGTIDVSDYASYEYHVSQSDVNAVKSAIADMKLPKPKKDITLIKD